MVAGWVFVCLCVCVSVCLQLMCSVKTAESVPSVWRSCCREKPLPGWLVSVSTIRGNPNPDVVDEKHV